MSKDKPIKIEYFRKTAVITFVRPDIKNPLSIETLRVLRVVFSSIENNPDIENAVITGSDNTFAAGANLNEVAKLNSETAREFGLRGQNLMQEIFHSKKQTIAIIDGFCMGGALDLAMSCNKRIASPNSFFAHPGAKLGIITGWSGTQMLPRLIGRKNALELLITAKSIDAKEALRIGLIDEVSENPLAKTIESF